MYLNIIQIMNFITVNNFYLFYSNFNSIIIFESLFINPYYYENDFYKF
jgi:hypothetical protein